MSKLNKKVTVLLLFMLLVSLGMYFKYFFHFISPLAQDAYSTFGINMQTKVTPVGKVGISDKGFFYTKFSRYPGSTILDLLAKSITSLKSRYFLDILIFLIVYLLGREVTKSKLGGLLAVAVAAFSSENIIQVMKGFSRVTLSYAFSWFVFYLILKYFKTKSTKYLVLMTLFSFLIVISYHTGGTAFIMFLLCSNLFIWLTYGLGVRDILKYHLSSLIVFLFYWFWIFTFDKPQVELMIRPFLNLHLLSLFTGVFLFFLLLLIIHKKRKYYDKLIRFSEKVIPKLIIALFFMVSFSLMLFFLKPSIIEYLRNFIIVLANTFWAKNYYISSTTLFVYITQFSLLHIYYLPLIPFFLKVLRPKTKLKPSESILLTWFLSLAVVVFGVVTQKFFTRVPDYTFPLAWFCFAFFWVKKVKFRKFIVPFTVAILIISLFAIYTEPFTMRRYYTHQEIDSVRGVINTFNPEDIIFSDLRTTSLLSDFGHHGVVFNISKSDIVNAFFYNISDENICSFYPRVEYAALSHNMKYIVNQENLQTTPLTQETFNKYKESKVLSQVYNDGLFEVYKLHCGGLTP